MWAPYMIPLETGGAKLSNDITLWPSVPWAVVARAAFVGAVRETGRTLRVFYYFVFAYRAYFGVFCIVTHGHKKEEET